MHKSSLVLFSLILLFTTFVVMAEVPNDKRGEGGIFVGLLIQDNVTDGVSTDLEAYRHFINGLPGVSRVMIGYARAGSNEIRQDFTEDRPSAAEQLRIPSGLPSTAPGSPYQAVKDLVKKFPEMAGKKVLIFVSDGIDRYGPLDSTPTNNPILLSAVRIARKRGVEIYTIFAPTGLSSSNRSLAYVGQDSLNYLAERTGGKAYFNGTNYVTAKAYLDKIQERISR